MGAADALQQQPGDLRLPVKLALGHPQLLLCLAEMKQNDMSIIVVPERVLWSEAHWQLGEKKI